LALELLDCFTVVASAAIDGPALFVVVLFDSYNPRCFVLITLGKPCGEKWVKRSFDLVCAADSSFLVVRGRRSVEGGPVLLDRP